MAGVGLPTARDGIAVDDRIPRSEVSPLAGRKAHDFTVVSAREVSEALRQERKRPSGGCIG